MADVNLAVIITGHGKDLINEFRKIGKEAESTGNKTTSAWSKVSTGVKVVGAAIVGTAVAIAAKSVEMADVYEKSHARLETALKNTGSSWEKMGKKIDAVSDSSAKFGFTKTEVEGALAQMTTGMGSVTKAVDSFQLAEDLAAAKGVPLADAALAVTKASEGMLRPLKQMGIDLPIAAGGAVKVAAANQKLAKAQDKLTTLQGAYNAGLIKGPQYLKQFAKDTSDVQAAQDKLNTTASAGTNILKALGEKLGGSAAAQADTFGGKMKAVKTQISNLEVAIGLKLIPILSKLADIIQTDVVPWVQKHGAAVKTLAIVMGGVAIVAITAYTIHMAAAAVATIAATWPILAIGAALIGVALLLKKFGVTWSTFCAGLKVDFEALHLPEAIDRIRPAIDAVGKAATWLGEHWGDIWRGIENTAIDAVNGITGTLNQLIRPINDLIQGLNDLNPFTNIGKLPTLGSVEHKKPPSKFIGPIAKFNPTFIGPLPQTAAGGIVTRAQAWIVGEAGPEAIIPLSRGRGLGSTYIINSYSLDPTTVEASLLKILRNVTNRDGAITGVRTAH